MEIDMSKYHVNLFVPSRYRTQMTFFMFLADLFGFSLAAVTMILINRLFNLDSFDFRWIEYSAVFLISMSLFMSSRLYPSVGINPADEMQLVTQYLSTGFISGAFLLVFFRQTTPQQFFAMIFTGFFSLIFILSLRWLIRIIAVQNGWWGEPVAILGQPEEIAQTAQYFLERRRLGFVPALAITDSEGCANLDIPVISLDKACTSDANRFADGNIQTLLVGASAALGVLSTETGKSLVSAFERIIFVSDMGWLDGASVSIHDFEGMIGIEAQRNYLRNIDAFAKRTLDLLLGFFLGMLFLPIIFVSIILIKLDSQGSIFYTQERIGKNGHKIKIYKLRSMVQDADHVLQDYLQSSLEAQMEWEKTQKLKNDPRITRVGYLIRKFSIDEMPQIYNVLKGDMSMVGPRPIMFGQEAMYGERFYTYCSVRPGITGLWQVSGRNNTTFEERARFDQYYVRNWSVWLDFYILLRTIWVVIMSDGAY